MSDAGLKATLRRRRDTQKPGSCYPCRERKVRCDKSQPCSTCLKQGYPDLCQYKRTDGGHAEAQRRHRSGAQPRPSPDIPNRATFTPTPTITQQYSPALLANPGSAVESELPGSSGIVALSGGSHDGAQPIQDNAQHHQQAFGSGIMPLLGVSSEDGTGKSPAIETVWKPIIEPLLAGSDVGTMFQSYRNRVYPFQAMPLDVDSIEEKLCLLLCTGNAPGYDTTLKIDQSVGMKGLCLLHAILASGAQASDLPLQKRQRLSRDHIKLAFEALQAMNYLSQPYKEAIQALLLIGNVLQNDMKPQAAWSLAGMTIRLAQCLGIHRQQHGGARATSATAADAAYLRKAIVWQDILLSMVFGRPPASHGMDMETDLEPMRITRENNAENQLGQGLRYREAMSWICHLSLCYVEASQRNPSASLLLQLLSDIDTLDSALCEYLRSRSSCASLQDVLQHYAFELHRNFVISTTCRHCISRDFQDAMGPDTETHQHVMSMLQDALRRGARAYLRMRTLSGYAHRAWASMHNGLTAVLFLSLMRETRHQEETRLLQKQLIDSLEADDEIGKNTDCLSSAHRNALNAIKALRKLTEQEASVSHSAEPPNSTSDQIRAAPEAVAESLQPDSNTNSNGGIEWDIDQWLTSFDFNQEPLLAFDYIMADSSYMNTTG